MNEPDGLYLWYVAMCTVEGCRSVQNTYTNQKSGAYGALVRDGWKLVGGGWRCPEHFPKRVPATHRKRESSNE